MTTTIRSILTLIALIFTLSGIAQRADPGDAKEHFKYGNFSDALKVYMKLMEKDPENIEYPYRAGLCVLFTARDKNDAVKYLVKASERKSDPDVDFYLGKAYHQVLNLEDALTAFRKYKTTAEGTKQNEVDREISSADIIDQATSQTEKTVEMRTLNRQMKLLSKINKAIKRIDDDTFGYCKETGEPIGLKRLIARPIATLSIEAQEKHEKNEKIFADT